MFARLLRWLTDASSADAIVGDLAEERTRGGEEEAPTVGTRRRLHHVTVGEDHQRGSAHRGGAEAHLARVHVGERGVAGRHGLAEAGAGGKGRWYRLPVEGGVHGVPGYRGLRRRIAARSV